MSISDIHQENSFGAVLDLEEFRLILSAGKFEPVKLPPRYAHGEELFETCKHYGINSIVAV